MYIQNVLIPNTLDIGIITQAWNAYNEAQKSEVKLFDELLKDLVQVIPEPEQTRGRPRLSARESIFCSIQKIYSQLSSHRAYSLFQNATERGQIDHAPHFNTPSRIIILKLYQSYTNWFTYQLYPYLE